jgi:YD repeat-containing protein
MSETNALGQLVAVAEDPTASIAGYTHTGTNLVTTYGYDTLSNLTAVNQGTQTPRGFAYSSLGRLPSASNPESGTVQYHYDVGGNVTQKVDARTVTTTYAYDQLNRPTSRSYTGVTTPAVTYAYDSGSVPYGKGKLTSVSSTVSTTAYTKYDATGKLLENTQTTAGLTVCSGTSAACLMSYKYNLAGEMTDEAYPSGRIVHQNYAADGKLNVVSSRAAANRPLKAYAQSFAYISAGADDGIQDIIGKKLLGPFVFGLEQVTSGKLKGRSLLELQSLFTSKDLILPFSNSTN